MKTLSIRQPWAWLILHGGKDIENRDWKYSCHYRGPLLIHASQTCSRDDYDAAVFFCQQRNLPLPPPRDKLERGGVVGVVDMVDCVRDSDSPWFVGTFGFVLENPRPLELYPCKGRLGLFDLELPPHVLEGIAL